MLGTVEWPFARDEAPESFSDPREREVKESILRGEMEFSDEENSSLYAELL